eukprot:1859781-Alexandrium_andersonii.AAC.1
MEESGRWPAGLLHWRVAFIPKVSSVSPHASQARPISVAPRCIDFGLSSGSGRVLSGCLAT